VLEGGTKSEEEVVDEAEANEEVGDGAKGAAE
jgi:hypothetical protein